MNRRSLVLAVLALAACGPELTAVRIPGDGPAAPLTVPFNRPSFSHIDYGDGRWTVTTVFPWTDDGYGAATAINNVGQVVGRQNGRAYRATPNMGDVIYYDEPNATPRAINDAGDVVGSVSPGGTTAAVFWRTNGERVDLSARPGAGSG